QTALIGIGAVIGSWLPYVLHNWFGVPNEDPSGGIPQHLIYSFILGAAGLVGSILVTIFTTKEYSPEELSRFADEKASAESLALENLGDPEPAGKARLIDIFDDFRKMPTTMRQL